MQGNVGFQYAHSMYYIAFYKSLTTSVTNLVLVKWRFSPTGRCRTHYRSPDTRADSQPHDKLLLDVHYKDFLSGVIGSLDNKVQPSATKTQQLRCSLFLGFHHIYYSSGSVNRHPLQEQVTASCEKTSLCYAENR